MTPAKAALVVDEKKEIVETKVEKVAEVIKEKEAEVKEKEVVVGEEVKHVEVKLDEKKEEKTPEETKIVTKEVENKVEKEVEDEDEDMVGVEGIHEEEIVVIASNIETSLEVNTVLYICEFFFLPNCVFKNTSDLFFHFFVFFNIYFNRLKMTMTRRRRMKLKLRK